MLRFFILFISLILCYASGIAQKVRPFSEKGNTTESETALFNYYLRKAVGFSGINSDSQSRYLGLAYHFAKRKTYSKGLAAYYHFLAADYNQNNHYDSAMVVIKKEIYWAGKSKDIASIAWAYNALANTYEYLGDMDSATTYFIKALNISEHLQGKGTKLSGTLNYNLASVMFLIQDYKKALFYANKGYRISLARKDTHMMANSLLDIGSIHVEMKNYDTALAIFNSVISLTKRTSDSSYIMDVLNDEGDLYAKRKQFSMSLKKYEQMLNLAKKYKDPYELLYAYGNLGITQLQIKQFNLAEKI